MNTPTKADRRALETALKSISLYTSPSARAFFAMGFAAGLRRRKRRA